jgi:spore maturation protein CgeB
VAGEVSFSFIGRESFRPLLVSSNLSWGTKAVFEGYREALLSLDVGVATFEYDEYARNFSTEIVRKILLGEICNKQLGFTHAIFIDGLSIPPWLVDSSPLTNILVSTEDPHALDVTRLLYPHYDYVFSNEKNAAEAFGVHYLPVAADPKAVDGLPNPVPEQYESDVLFLGAIYPSRMKVLEEIAEICERRGWRFRIVGPRHCCSPGGRVAEIVDERIVPTREALLYQAGAKVCLNLFRDPAEGHNAEFGLQGWSMNPRCYDVPLCGSSLLTDFRGEVKRVFGMDCVMNRENLETQLEKNLQDASGRKEKASQEVKTVLDGHLYVHRALVLAACIGQGFLVPAQ